MKHLILSVAIFALGSTAFAMSDDGADHSQPQTEVEVTDRLTFEGPAREFDSQRGSWVPVTYCWGDFELKGGMIVFVGLQGGSYTLTCQSMWSGTAETNYINVKSVKVGTGLGYLEQHGRLFVAGIGLTPDIAYGIFQEMEYAAGIGQVSGSGAYGLALAAGGNWSPQALGTARYSFFHRDNSGVGAWIAVNFGVFTPGSGPADLN